VGVGAGLIILTNLWLGAGRKALAAGSRKRTYLPTALFLDEETQTRPNGSNAGNKQHAESWLGDRQNEYWTARERILSRCSGAVGNPKQRSRILQKAIP
jgi:hypothetical protein